MFNSSSSDCATGLASALPLPTACALRSRTYELRVCMGLPLRIQLLLLQTLATHHGCNKPVGHTIRNPDQSSSIHQKSFYSLLSSWLSYRKGRTPTHLSPPRLLLFRLVGDLGAWVDRCAAHFRNRSNSYCCNRSAIRSTRRRDLCGFNYLTWNSNSLLDRGLYLGRLLVDGLLLRYSHYFLLDVTRQLRADCENHTLIMFMLRELAGLSTEGRKSGVGG